MYVFRHLCVRNDKHCPYCRKQFVALYPTHAQAYKEHGENIPNGVSSWTDEWERRGNGDLRDIARVDIGCSDVSMLLHVRINTSVYCPDNIRYRVAFFTSYKDAAKEEDLRLKKDRQYLLEGNSVWEANEAEDGGHFYRVVKIPYGKTICLNYLCEQLEQSFK